MNYLDYLAESLYLSPRLPEADVEEGLRQLGLEFPLQMAVGRNDAGRAR